MSDAGRIGIYKRTNRRERRGTRRSRPLALCSSASLGILCGLCFLARSLPNQQSFPPLSCQMHTAAKQAKQKLGQLPIVLISGSKGSPSSGNAWNELSFNEETRTVVCGGLSLQQVSVFGSRSWEMRPGAQPLIHHPDTPPLACLAANLHCSLSSVMP